MNAKEAREKTILFRDTNCLKHYKKIMLFIKTAVSEGYFFIYFYEDVSIEVINKLKEEGYSVEDLSSQREDYTIKIEW